MNELKIARINELAHKQKAGTLTSEEKEEQAILRKEFVEFIKGQVKNQLKHVHFKEDSSSCSCGCGHDHDHHH